MPTNTAIASQKSRREATEIARATALDRGNLMDRVSSNHSSLVIVAMADDELSLAIVQ